jgi:hypothetical protein
MKTTVTTDHSKAEMVKKSKITSSTYKIIINKISEAESHFWSEAHKRALSNYSSAISQAMLEDNSCEVLGLIQDSLQLIITQLNDPSSTRMFADSTSSSSSFSTSLSAGVAHPFLDQYKLYLNKVEQHISRLSSSTTISTNNLSVSNQSISSSLTTTSLSSAMTLTKGSVSNATLTSSHLQLKHNNPKNASAFEYNIQSAIQGAIDGDFDKARKSLRSARNNAGNHGKRFFITGLIDKLFDKPSVVVLRNFLKAQAKGYVHPNLQVHIEDSSPPKKNKDQYKANALEDLKSLINTSSKEAVSSTSSSLSSSLQLTSFGQKDEQLGDTPAKDLTIASPFASSNSSSLADSLEIEPDFVIPRFKISSVNSTLTTLNSSFLSSTPSVNAKDFSQNSSNKESSVPHKTFSDHIQDAIKSTVSNERSAALMDMTSALHNIHYSESQEEIGKVYFIKGLIYKHFLDYKKALTNFKQARVEGYTHRNLQNHIDDCERKKSKKAKVLEELKANALEDLKGFIITSIQEGISFASSSSSSSNSGLSPITSSDEPPTIIEQDSDIVRSLLNLRYSSNNKPNSNKRARGGEGHGAGKKIAKKATPKQNIERNADSAFTTLSLSSSSISSPRSSKSPTINESETSTSSAVSILLSSSPSRNNNPGSRESSNRPAEHAAREESRRQYNLRSNRRAKTS